MPLPRERFCPSCGTSKPASEYYTRRKGRNLSAYCKLCTRKASLSALRDFKEKCVEYKGGFCEKCGYDRYFGALEFHHVNPKNKDFEISSVKRNLLCNVVKKELDKCLLLCSNCHAEEHYLISEGIKFTKLKTN